MTAVKTRKKRRKVATIVMKRVTNLRKRSKNLETRAVRTKVVKAKIRAKAKVREKTKARAKVKTKEKVRAKGRKARSRRFSQRCILVAPLFESIRRNHNYPLLVGCSSRVVIRLILSAA